MAKPSLAVRIFSVNLVVMVLPLAVVLVLFFANEKRDNLRAIFHHLTDIAYSRAQVVAEQGAFKAKLANVLVAQLKLDDHPDLKAAEIEFQKIVSAAPLVQALILTQKNIVVASSFPQYDGLNVGGRSFLREGISLGYGLPGLARIFYTKALGNETFFTISSDPQQLLANLINTDYTSWGMNFSLVTEAGVIFASSDPTLVGMLTRQLSEGQELALQKEGEVLDIPVDYVSLTPIEHPGFTGLFSSGQRIGVVVPIAGSEATLMVDVIESEAVWGFDRHLWNSLFTLVITALFTSLILWFVLHRLVQPLRRLMEMMSRISRGDFAARFVSTGGGFEINEIGLSMNAMLDHFLQTEETVKTEQVKQEMFSRELNIGHQIQQQILPQHLPPTQPFAVAAIAKPALEVGGDFYDVFLLEEEKKILVVVADVSGKGISACLFSLVIRSMLRSFGSQNTNIAEAVRKAGDLFCLDTEQSSMFVTVFAGALDPASKTFAYFSAGHLPALLKRGLEVTELWTPGLALGIGPCDNIEQKTLQLQEGDTLLLYTDGVTENMNAAGELYGDGRLKKFLQETKNNDPQALLDELMGELERFEGTAPQHDDITCVAIHVLPPKSAGAAVAPNA